MKTNSVLVVDDEDIVRESIRDWLVDAGYDVSTAETAEEARWIVTRQDFAVVVLDVRLPGQTGLSVLKQIKAERPWVKSIIITAYPSEETVAEANRLGAIDLMVKPVVPDDLEKLVRGCIESVGKEPTVTVAEAPVTPRVKQTLVITKNEFNKLVDNLIQSSTVIGVREKSGKYLFDEIHKSAELKLDYDVTILPPTAFLFPPREAFLKFNKDDITKSEAILDISPRAIVGVHPYDIKAIQLLDEAFIPNNPDPNYISRRENTMIIGIDCLNPSPKNFSSSMGTDMVEDGFDLKLTDIGKNYMVMVGSQKGADLLSEYTATMPTIEDIARQKMVLDEARSKFRQHLQIPRERILKLLEDSYDDVYWQTRSESCLSCGSCVMVCPTCFCFDVQDEISLNLKEGQRVRQWDGCVLSDFARVATGENFRHDKASRFRHRIYRKGKYLLERYGMMGCVGCGRCATSCLAGIASPLEAFNAIAESNRAKQANQRVVRDSVSKSELYNPRPARLVRIERLSAHEKVFEFKLLDGNTLGHKPGQFVSVSLVGLGEAPISVTSSPTREGSFELAIRNVGDVTNAIHSLEKGAVVGIRGPFGNGFPTGQMEGKDILFIAGGIGLFPLRSLVQYVMDRRKDFGRAILLLGSRSPAERMFVEEITDWKNSPALEFQETVDRGDGNWKGNVGVITTLIPKVQIDPKKTVAVVVGPPVMYRFVIVELKKRDIADENIIMSLERRMKCGVGKCGHCQINGVYVCQEGPVFSLAQLRNLREAV